MSAREGMFLDKSSLNSNDIKC